MKTLIRLLTVIVLLSGLILPLVQVSPAAANMTSEVSTTTVNTSVAASTDDCLARYVIATTTWDLLTNDTYVRSGYIFSQKQVGAGMRFQLNVPQGATVTEATINFTCALSIGDDVVNTVFHGEATDNASTFSNIANYQARRGTDCGGADNTSLTTSEVYWDNLDTWYDGTEYQSPDIGIIVQEIVNRPGWQSGNYIVIFWDDHLGRSTEATGRNRTAASWDNATYDPPELIVTYATAERTGITHLYVDSQDHEDYGLTFPVTYQFLIPSGSSNLTAWKRYSESDNWTSITENTTSDFFNNIEAVRFDYDHSQAYVSVGFSSDTDDIYLKITDSGGNIVDVVCYYIPTYYDNRKSAVVATLDDWSDSYGSHNYMDEFDEIIDEFQARQIWVTCAIVTSSTNATSWGRIQGQMDEGFVEPASHSRTHPNPPYADTEGEVNGSKLDITSNLTMPANYSSGSNEYVYTWVQPRGYCDAAIWTQMGVSKYVADRNFPAVSWGIEPFSDFFFDWSDTYGVYDEISLSRIIDNDGGPNSTVNATVLNGHFDDTYAEGSIYHVMGHPYSINATDAYVQDHLDHIAGHNDVWYTGFGTLYLYHMVDDQGIVTYADTGLESAAPASPTGFSATDGTNTASVNCTWTPSDNATGQLLFRDGVQIADLGPDVDHYEDTDADAGIITPGTASASDGTSTDHVTCAVSGESAAAGTTHTYKLSAYNESGASENVTDDGNRGIGATTYQWQRSAADSDASYSNIGGGTTDPYNDTGAPEDGSGRYFRCVLSADGAEDATTMSNRGFRGAPPVLAFIGNQSVTVNTTLQFTISATGIGTISYGVLNNPAGSSINSTTGVFTWVPDTAGTYSAVSFNATNEYGNDTENITITVSAAATTNISKDLILISFMFVPIMFVVVMFKAWKTASSPNEKIMYGIIMFVILGLIIATMATAAASL